jgi:guanylate kinase
MNSTQDHLSDYKPNNDMLDRLKNVELLLVVGPSGVGKTSITTALGIPIVVGDTSRPMRVGEKEGVEYHFRSESEMLSGISKGEYLQAVIDSGGDLKATNISSFPSTGTATLTLIADEVPHMRSLPFRKTTTVFIVPPSYAIWMERMKSHRLDERQFKKRIDEARKSFSFALNDDKVNLVLNDNLDEAIGEIKNILDGRVEKSKVENAREVAAQILDVLKRSG